jgi:hypothetical protein
MIFLGNTSFYAACGSKRIPATVLAGSRQEKTPTDTTIGWALRFLRLGAGVSG